MQLRVIKTERASMQNNRRPKHMGCVCRVITRRRPRNAMLCAFHFLYVASFVRTSATRSDIFMMTSSGNGCKKGTLRTHRCIFQAPQVRWMEKSQGHSRTTNECTVPRPAAQTWTIRRSPAKQLHREGQAGESALHEDTLVTVPVNNPQLAVRFRCRAKHRDGRK